MSGEPPTQRTDRSEPPDAPEPRDRRWLAGIALIALAGLATRVVAIFDAFWIDEIWSWGLAREAGSLGGVFKIAHDNNHQLNTLWMRIVGVDAPWPSYRLLSLASSAVTIALAALLSWRRDRREALFASALVAASLYFTVFGSEARGYAPMLALALAATWALRRVFERPTAARCAFFAVCAMLGICAHFTFAHAYGALFAWSAAHWARSEPRFATWLKRMLAAHSAPIAAWILEYAYFMRDMTIGGGPIRSLPAVLGETIVQGFGAPDAPGVALVAALLLAALLVADVVLARRAGSNEWILTVCAVVIVPTLAILVTRPQFLAPRYFLVSLLFATLAFARVCAALAKAGRARALVAYALVAVVVLGNAARVASFLSGGRGHYLEALRRILRDTHGPIATLSATEDFDMKFMLSFYGRALPSTPQLAFYPREARPAGGTEWLLVESVERDPHPMAVRRLSGIEYALVDVFPFGGTSGWSWILYRRANASADPQPSKR